LKQAVELRVQTIVAQFEYKYPIMVIGPEEIMIWRQRLAQKGLYQYDRFLSLDGISNVRNVCLLAAVLSSSEVAILFDDDEVYDDPAYLEKALEFIGKEHEGSFVGGVAGYYKREEYPEDFFTGDEDWKQKWGSVESMNEAIELIDREPRLKKAPVAFGGNMVIHRSVFERVPFDPAIPRGEDIDYLMNAGLFGYDFFLDNELLTKHMPPPKCAPPWFQLRLDIIRFARERAKLLSPVTGSGQVRDLEPEDFDPYPGRFLKSNLHDIVFEASISMASEYYEDGREDDAGECIMNIAISKAEANIGRDALDEYLEYQGQWQEFVSLVPNVGIWHPTSTSD
jgi:hypothetical protein